MNRVPADLLDHPQLNRELGSDHGDEPVLLRHVIDKWLTDVEIGGFTHRLPIRPLVFPLLHWQFEAPPPIRDLYDRIDLGYVVGYGKKTLNLVEIPIGPGKIEVTGELLDQFGQMIERRYSNLPKLGASVATPTFGGYRNQTKGVYQIEPVVFVETFLESLQIGHEQVAVFSVTERAAVMTPKWEEPDSTPDV